MGHEMAAEYGAKAALNDALEKGATVEEAREYMRSQEFIQDARRYAEMFLEEFGA